MLLTRALPILLVVLSLVACRATPKPPLPEPEVAGGPTEDFEALRTPQVFVEPVEGPPAAPNDAVRGAFYRELVERAYAPLRLDLEPATIPELVGSGGVGRVRVSLSRWDRGEIRARSVIIAAGEAAFVVGDRTIWESTFHDVAVRCVEPGEPRNPAKMDARAAEGLARQVLRSLPVKR